MHFLLLAICCIFFYYQFYVNSSSFNQIFYFKFVFGYALIYFMIYG